MNKKLTTIGVSVALGGIMLFTAAYGAFAGSSGYESYKSAFKNTISAKSITPKIQISVSDNGNALVNVDSTMKINKENKSSSGSITVTSGDQQNTTDIYRQNGQTIIKNSDSDTYQVTQFDKSRKQGEQQPGEKDLNSALASDIENVIDAVVGNIQNYITIQNNPDGTNDVALHLTDSQIPPVVNAVTSLLVKNAERENTHGKHVQSPVEGMLQQKIPQLVSDIKVTSDDTTAKISNDNFIQNQTVNITISGKDADGNNHQIEINANIDLSGFNSTNPDTVDLTGQKVQTVQHEKAEQ